MDARDAGAEAWFANMAQQGSGPWPGYNPQEGADMGIPGLGLFNLFAMPIMSSVAAQTGMFPGQFNPTVNVADQLRATLAQRQMMAEMSRGAKEHDVNTWLGSTAGMMRMSGAAYGLDQQAGFRQAYEQAAPMMSILGMVAPELVDSLHGLRGSAAVMNQHLFRGAQYRASMSTGLPGMRGDDVKELSEAIEKHLFSDPDKLADMRGMGMGQVGKLFDEAQRRGYMSSSLSVRSKGGQIDELARSTDKTAEELGKMDNAEFGRKVKEFDTTRITGRLKELAQSLSAMRDLFGSAGQPNAPLPQLLNALEALTQNRLATMPASAVENIVRHTKALMETTGVSLEGFVGLTSLAANYGDQMGLDRSLAIAAGQHAVGFATAYKQAFGGDYKAFGAMTPDELAHREAYLGQRAAASKQAQFAGATIRTVEALKLKPDTKAGRLAQALRNGETEFEGQSMFQVLRNAPLQDIMRESGAGPEGVKAFVTASQDKFGNQEYIQRHDLGNLVRKLQPQEIAATLGRAAGTNALLSALTATGMSQPEAMKIARKSGSVMMQSLIDSESPEKLSTQEGRQKIYQTALRKELGDKLADQIGPAAMLSFESQANRQFQHYGFGDLGKGVQSMNRMVLRQEANVQRMAAADAEVDKALAPLGRAGPIARVMQFLQTAKKDTPIPDALATMLGGLDVGDIQDMVKKTETVRGLVSKEKLTPEDRVALDTARKEMTQAIEGVQAKAKKKGVDVGRNVDDDDVKYATKSHDEVLEALKGPVKNRTANVTRAVSKELANTNNLVQALYLDEASVRKLGVGGVDRLKSLEAKYTRMLRRAGGDPAVVAKALADDKSIPEDQRRDIQALHKKMGDETAEVGKLLLGGGKPMTDAEFKTEKEKLDAFKKTRETSDDEQTKSMIDRMAEVGGIDTKSLSKKDRETLTGYLGKFGETKRKDIMLALDARERLQAASKETGLSLKDLNRDAKYGEDFRQAGALAEFAKDGKDNFVGLEEALKGFGKADNAKGAAKEQKFTIDGKVKLEGGEISGVGYTSMGAAE